MASPFGSASNPISENCPVAKEEPLLVVELGSGSSTIVSGYALKKNEKGRIISFDHLEEYADRTREMVLFHSLNGYCDVLHTPLTTCQLKGTSWKWYNLESFSPVDPIDMVIVDGPPARLQRLSRYPALPLLSNWLSDEAIIVVDDGARKDERIVVEQWMEQYPHLKCQYLETEEGTYILRPS